MNNILILRTFTHQRVWESDKNGCEYTGEALRIIDIWEPTLTQETILNTKFALGIYSSGYFTRPDRSGRIPFTGSVDENDVSFLRLQSIDSFSHFSRMNNGTTLTIVFSFIQKLGLNTRKEMFDLEAALISKKQNFLDSKQKMTRYPALCFSLPTSAVEEMIELPT